MKRWRAWAALALLFGAGFDVGLLVGRHTQAASITAEPPETQYQMRRHREETPLL